MVHRIQEVCAKDDYVIEATFFNGESRAYDMKQLFSVFPQFCIFEQDEDLFRKVSVDPGGYGVSWNDELDLDAETIWCDGLVVEVRRETGLNHILAYRLLLARELAGMTQKELADRTGIYQADISKIERGIGNPSLSTLKRLADGLGMELYIDFVNKI